LLKQSAKHASTAASLNVIQNVVLYENLIVDGFVLANDERAIIAKALRDTVKALYLNRGLCAGADLAGGMAWMIVMVRKSPVERRDGDAVLDVSDLLNR